MREKEYLTLGSNKMKYILSIETTGKYASAAVIAKDNDSVKINFKKSDKEMNHLVDLIEIIDAAIEDAGIKIEDIDLVSPCIGPGSFTGIRIGVSTARALSQACNIGGIPVGTLRAMLENDIQRKMEQNHYVCTTIYARRNQTYAALWKVGSKGEIEEVLRQRQYMIDELLNLISGIDDIKSNPLIFYGDGSDEYYDQISDEMNLSGIQFYLASQDIRYQNARGLAYSALTMIEEGFQPVSYNELIPDYMRKTEAEMKLEQEEDKC